MKNKSLILAIFLILVVFLSSSAVFAEDADIQSANADVLEVQQNYIEDMQASSTFNIKAGSSSDEIQNTINSMKDGDVLNFENGTYTDICIYINKSITVNGNGANLVGYNNASTKNVPTIITNTSAAGGYAIGNVATLYIVNAENVSISGLTITSGANSSSRDTNPAYSNALVYVQNSNNLNFKNNILDGSSWGIYLRFSNDCQLVENTIKNQAVTGILSFGSARTQIEKNTIIDAKNHGIDVRHGTGPNVQVINNSVSGSQEGIYLMHSQGHTAAYNTIENCTISSISCYGSSNIEIYNNTMKKSRIGLLLGGGYSNIKVGANTFALDNLPYPPTFVYNVAEAKSDFSSATKMMGTHSDGADSEFPYYVEYTGIPTPKEINVDYDVILNPTGVTYTVPEGATSEQIQTMIASMNDGDTLSFAENAVYKDISIYTDKNIKILGNGATLIGYDNLNITNCPTKITETTANNGYAISERAVLYVVNNTNAVVSNLNIIAQYPGYDPNTVVGPTTIEYKTVGIRTKNAVNVTITGCTIDGASWGIYMEYSHNAIVTNNDIKNQFTTGILNFGTGYSILANNTITDAVNHGIDVRHGTGPAVTVFNNTISGSKEGIYLMHSKGHTVYNNTITNGVISGITCYGSGSESIFNNSISGSRLGIILGGGYYNVTIGPNTYSLDSLPFPPTFVSYLVKVETARQSTADKVYSDKNTVTIEPTTFETEPGEFNYTISLSDDSGFAVKNQEITVSVNDENYTLTTNAKGTATVPLDLTAGDYTALINFAGTDNYAKAAANTTITVKQPKADMIISAVYDAANSQVVATLTNNATGKAIANTKLQVDINGETTTAKTNSKGKATISTADLSTGTYTATISYAGNSKYNPASTNITFTTKTEMIISEISGNSHELTATLINGATGKAISGASVTVDINGVSTTVKSNSKGQIKAYVPELDGGDTYTATISYKGNAKYNAASASAAIDLTKTNMVITAKYNSDNKQIVATVTNAATGKAVANTNVKVSINGVTTTAKTNGKGITTISTSTLAPGTYVGIISYAGNAKYNAASTTATAIIE